jgi:hypothetical protein
MSRNTLYALISLLIVAGGVMGYMLYQDRQQTGRLEIDVGKNGLSIEKK